MSEEQLPTHIQLALIAVQIIAVAVFLYFVIPHIKGENWKEKFIHNKTARSYLIVFVLILLFSWGMGLFFDTFFPVEELR